MIPVPSLDNLRKSNTMERYVRLFCSDKNAGFMYAIVRQVSLNKTAYLESIVSYAQWIRSLCPSYTPLFFTNKFPETEGQMNNVAQHLSHRIRHSSNPSALTQFDQVKDATVT